MARDRCLEFLKLRLNSDAPRIMATHFRHSGFLFTVSPAFSLGLICFLQWSQIITNKLAFLFLALRNTANHFRQCKSLRYEESSGIHSHIRRPLALFCALTIPKVQLVRALAIHKLLSTDLLYFPRFSANLSDVLIYSTFINAYSFCCGSF